MGAGIALAAAGEHAGPSFGMSVKVAAVQGISVATVLVVPAVRGVREIVSAIVDSPEAAAAVA